MRSFAYQEHLIRHLNLIRMVNYYFEVKKSLFVRRCLQESFILISKISFLEGPHNLPNAECQDRKKKRFFFRSILLFI